MILRFAIFNIECKSFPDDLSTINKTQFLVNASASKIIFILSLSYNMFHLKQLRLNTVESIK